MYIFVCSDNHKDLNIFQNILTLDVENAQNLLRRHFQNIFVVFCHKTALKLRPHAVIVLSINRCVYLKQRSEIVTDVNKFCTSSSMNTLKRCYTICSWSKWKEKNEFCQIVRSGRKSSCPVKQNLWKSNFVRQKRSPARTIQQIHACLVRQYLLALHRWFSKGTKYWKEYVPYWPLIWLKPSHRACRAKRSTAMHCQNENVKWSEAMCLRFVNVSRKSWICWKGWSEPFWLESGTLELFG